MKGRKGFTLIEILVALSILGIGLAIVLQLFSGGLRSAKISEEYTKALWYGKAKMEEMLATKELTEGETEGRFDSQYSWRAEVEKANPSLGLREEEASLPVDLYRIVLRVTWASGAGQRRLEIESLRVFKAAEKGSET